MDKKLFEETQDAMSAPERSHESLVTVKPQQHSQHDFSAQHPLLQWAQTFNLDDSWASDNELSSFEVRNNFDDDIEALLSNTNHGYGNIDGFGPSASGKFEEIEYVDPGSVHGHGGLPHESTRPQLLQSGVSMDTPPVLLDAQSRRRPYQAVKNLSTGPFETFDGVFVAGTPTNLGTLENGPGLTIPHVVVSHAAVNCLGLRSQTTVPALHTNIPSPKRHHDEKQTLDQNSCNALASGENTRNLSDNSRYRPNNYQIAMVDRRTPPYTLGNGEQIRFEKPIADSVSAFYADADRTVLDHAAFPKTDESFGFNMRCVTESIPRFQTSIRHPPGLQHCRSSSSNTSSRPSPRSSLQASLYSTSPSSFQELTACQQVDSHLTSNRSPSNPARLPSDCLTDPSSLSSFSLPNGSDETKESCGCTLCPDKTFTDTSNLMRHIRDRHKGMARLPCLKEGCDASFAPGRKDNQLKHVRAKHPDYPLPTPSKKRKRNADGNLESGSMNMQSFESGTTG